MKKVIFIFVTLFALLTISCTNETMNRTLQSGSVWRSAGFTDSSMSAAFEYYEIRFITATTIELWVKRTAGENPEKVNQTYGYILKDKTIAIDYDHVTTVGTMDDSSMNISENGIPLKFIKL